MLRDKVVDLLRKLQSLADTTRNNSPAEAELAAAQMQRLMIEHKISMVEVSAEYEDPITELNVLGTLNKSGRPAKKVMAWQSMLCSALCRAHHCQCLVGTGRLLVVGTESDAHAVHYLYRYLCNEMGRIGRKAPSPPHTSRRKFMNAFRVGFIQAINERLEKQREAAFHRMESSTQALVRAEDIRVINHIKIKYPYVKSANCKVKADADGFTAGCEAGADVSLGGGPGLKQPAQQIKEGG